MLQDPYELTTKKLIEADNHELNGLRDTLQSVSKRIELLEARIAAYELTLQGYKALRPGLQASNGANPYSEDERVAGELSGLTTLLQKMIKLGLINDRRFKATASAHLLIRIGAVGGKPVNLPGRIYTLAKDHADIFKWIAPGEFEILPGAEAALDEKYSEPLGMRPSLFRAVNS